LNIHTDLKENPRIPLFEIASFWKVADHVFLNASLQMSKGIGVPEDQMAQVYQSSDVFLHTCNGGGWELPPMEAAACGLPVVAADAPAQNEWIRTLPGSTLVPGKCQWDSTCSGYRVYASVDDVLQALLDQIENRDKHRQLGLLNSQHCVDNYSWDSIVPQWEALFNQLLVPGNKTAGWRMLQEV
jgi:glycosyltransferase involved in cell wall biosynthesis